MNAFQTEIIEKINSIINNQKADMAWVQNTLSTLSGVLFGAVLTIFTQKIGILKCYKVNYSHKYYNMDGFGGQNEISDEGMPEYIQINLTMDFQNTTQVNIGIRNIQVVIYDENKNKIIYKLKDDDTRRNGNSGVYMDTLETLNIEANKIVRKKLGCTIYASELGNFSKIAKTFFSYTTKNNRNKRIRVA